MNEWALNMSHTVGSVSCLVVLYSDTVRCESRCPLYHVPLFCAQSHFKLVVTDLQAFANLILNFYWPPFKLWLTLFTAFYWLDYKLLLTSTITNFYWPHCWPHDKISLISLQTLADLTTKLGWPHYKTLLISLQNFTDLITKFCWPHYKTFTDVLTLTSWQTSPDLITDLHKYSNY